MEKLTTSNGNSIDSFELKCKTLIHGVTVIYGKTGSGKSTIVKHLMYVLKEEIDVCIVVSPSEASNSTYGEHMIDRPMIHSSIQNGELLKTILSWQEMRASIYRNTIDLNIIKSLYSKISSTEIDSKINKINDKMNTLLPMLTDKVQEERLRTDFNNLLLKIYKPYLIQQKHRLTHATMFHTLSKTEKIAISYINMNPNILVIFDDCAADLRPFFNKDEFRTIFYNGRHSFITVILCCQDDTDLHANLRKNAKLAFFTDPIVTTSNFERSSNKYPKALQDTIRNSILTVFKENRKLVYDGKNIYHFTANLFPPFRFGSTILKTLCSKLSEGVDAVNVNNPFYKNFKL